MIEVAFASILPPMNCALILARYGVPSGKMLDVAALLAARPGARPWVEKLRLLFEIRLPRWLALELSQALLGGIGLAGSGERLNHSFVTDHGFLGLPLLDPGLGQRKVEHSQTIAERVAGFLHPLRIALNVGCQLNGLGPFRKVGIVGNENLTMLQGVQILVGAEVFLGLGQ